MTAFIVGWGHTPFGRHDDADLEALIIDATRQAAKHAEVDPTEINAIFLGHLNGGFIRDSFVSSLVLQADDRLRFVPATRVENALASGSAAVFQGVEAIESGRARRVLVVGAEKMTAVTNQRAGEVLASASYVRDEAARALTFPGIFGRITQAYFEKCRYHSATLARIAAKNHASGVRNPRAHIRKDLGFDFWYTAGPKNPMIAPPLRRTNCSTVRMARLRWFWLPTNWRQATPSVCGSRQHFKSTSFCRWSVGTRSHWRAHGVPGSVRPVRSASPYELCRSRRFMTVSRSQNCAPMRPWNYEAMGLAEAGQGARLSEEGISALDGFSLPISPSGGLKAKGHPVGAMHVSMQVLSAIQLDSEAGDFQVSDAQLCGVFNMRRSAVANYVSVLEAA